MKQKTKQTIRRLTWQTTIIAVVAVVCLTGIIIVGVLTGHDGKLITTGALICGAVAFGAVGIPVGLLLGRPILTRLHEEDEEDRD